MTSAARKIFDDAMDLPQEDRRIVAEALLHSVTEVSDQEIHPAWRDEIIRRIEQVQRNEVQAEPWSEVRAQMRRALQR
ncbi:MAG: addiction module protein [Myxococcota bacterium]